MKKILVILLFLLCLPVFANPQPTLQKQNPWSELEEVKEYEYQLNDEQLKELNQKISDFKREQLLEEQNMLLMDLIHEIHMLSY